MTRKGKDAPHKFIQTHVSVLNSVVPMAPPAVSWRPTGDLLATYWRPNWRPHWRPHWQPTGSHWRPTGNHWRPVVARYYVCALATTGDPGDLATWRPGDLATCGDLATAVATALCC